VWQRLGQSPKPADQPSLARPARRPDSRREATAQPWPDGRHNPACGQGVDSGEQALSDGTEWIGRTFRVNRTLPGSRHPGGAGSAVRRPPLDAWMGWSPTPGSSSSSKRGRQGRPTRSASPPSCCRPAVVICLDYSVSAQRSRTLVCEETGQVRLFEGCGDSIHIAVFLQREPLPLSI